MKTTIRPFLFALSISLIVSTAQALTTQEKLSGPVTDFIQQAELSHTPFLADTTKNIGVLRWRATGEGQPIVIVPGRGEIGYMWAETAYDLRTMGAQGDIFVWDPPGQGLSDRLLPDERDVGHIEHFDDYTESLVAFLRKVKFETKQTPVLMAHSMGGAISLNTLEEDSTLATHLILISPMLDIHISKYPIVQTLADGLAEVLYRLNLFQHYVVGRSGKGAPITSDADRLAFERQIRQRFNGVEPGKTLRWVAAANRGINSALQNVSRIKIPILTFVAGGDTVVDPDGAEKLKANCNGHCTVVVIPESGHAIHEEQNVMRNQMLMGIANLLNLDCTKVLLQQETVKAGLN